MNCLLYVLSTIKDPGSLLNNMRDQYYAFMIVNMNGVSIRIKSDVFTICYLIPKIAVHNFKLVFEHTFDRVSQPEVPEANPKKPYFLKLYII